MNYFTQLKTVSLWEYKRFYKIKNELIGIVVLLVIFVAGYFGGNFFAKMSDKKQELTFVSDYDTELKSLLAKSYIVTTARISEKEEIKKQITEDQKGMVLWREGNEFVLFAWKSPSRLGKLEEILCSYERERKLSEAGLSADDFDQITSPASLTTQYVFENPGSPMRVTAIAFAFIMVMTVFLSFAYQFTAITGEKQLKITEQIVSAIKPQVWMDGKILGITLTGLSSMVTYFVLSILGGMLLFLLSGSPVSRILEYIHGPSIILYFLFTLVGILMWNSVMAAIAAVITDPNNSGKGSLMMLPSVFVLLSLMVLSDPDSPVAVFLSWFPITSASGMPMRWITTQVPMWEVAGSFILLCGAFWAMRKLAATIFKVTILISGKEPTWSEVIKMAKS